MPQALDNLSLNGYKADLLVAIRGFVVALTKLVEIGTAGLEAEMQRAAGRNSQRH